MLDLAEMPRAKKARRGRKSSFLQEERELKDLICDHRQQGYVVTWGTIRMKAKQIINDKSFLASAGWCTRFMWRNKLALQQKTKICQRLPADLKKKITSFQCFVIHQRLRHSYPLSQIGNMDEAPVFFDLPSNRTVDYVGSKTVTIRTTGHDITHFTAVLGCMADGTKLPPMVIFK